MSERRPILKLPLAICFLSVLFLWPIVGVSRPMKPDFLTNPQLSAYAVCFFAACLTYWEDIASLFAFNKRDVGPRLHVLGWCTYLALFLTSCLLCRRLKVCIVHIHNILAPTWAWLGLPLVIAGAVMVIRSGSEKSPEKSSEKQALIAYPQFTGLLLILAGLSIAHWTWLGLMALPGILVVESWYIKVRENSSLEKVDAPKPRARFRVLPFIY